MSAETPSATKPLRSADVATALKHAVVLHQQGRLAEADALYRTILAAEPGNFDALHLAGVAQAQQGNAEAAVALIEKALGVNPSHPSAHLNLANALRDLNRPADALASYDRALALKPDFAQAFNNRGNALADLGRPDDAIASFDRALALVPDDAEIHFKKGNAWGALGRYGDAIASFERALAVRPNHAEALNNRGSALAELGRHEEALASYDRALALRPDDAEVHYNRGNALFKLNFLDEAEASFERALALNPDHAEALYNRGVVLGSLRRHEDAARSFERLMAVAPEHPFAAGNRLHAKLHACDWDGYEAAVADITARVRAGGLADQPFSFLSISGSTADQQQCARSYARSKLSPSPSPLWTGQRYAHDKIRIAYLSADFHNHAVSYLLARTFETHDKARFDVTAISFGPDAEDAMRKRLMVAFDRFIDARALSDRAIAERLREIEIDIAVDLKGYTRDARPKILAYRPAPIQVSYMGYPSTMGADFIDYLIADPIVIPAEHRAFYDEKVIHLPDTYWATDSTLRISERTPTRADVGLPEEGFVFCCFNNNFKITPPVFAIWMRLLANIEGSVLWLLEDNTIAARNLRRAAQGHGIAPERLVFAPRAELADHLARHRLADLLLDTLPYNAHTTTSDALWVGLPVLTCVGTAFAGRVAAGLLGAIGLPELITTTAADYEAMALTLATVPATLAAIKAKLAHNRSTHPLFDSDRFRRHMEQAYATMWERHQRGAAPEGFAVDPL